VQSITDREVVLRNYAGKTFRYVLPEPNGSKPDGPGSRRC
jgi:hypothetical protein